MSRIRGEGTRVRIHASCRIEYIEGDTWHKICCFSLCYFGNRLYRIIQTRVFDCTAFILAVSIDHP